MKYTRNKVLTEVINKIGTISGVDEIGLDDKLQNLLSDSLDSIDLQLKLEDCFDIYFKDDEYNNIDDVNDLIESVISKLREKGEFSES